MFNKKNLFRIGGATVLIVGTFLGTKIFKGKNGDTEQTNRDTTPAQLPTQILLETSDNKWGENTSEDTPKKYKTNSVSTYEIVNDPFGSDTECLQVGINTVENPQTAFGVVRAIGDPEKFDSKVDLLFKDGQGGYIKMKTFGEGETPGPEWHIIQPGTIACERGY